MILALDDAFAEGHDGGCDDDDSHGDMSKSISYTATPN